jgi:hypothetical protein
VRRANGQQRSVALVAAIVFAGAACGGGGSSTDKRDAAAERSGDVAVGDAGDEVNPDAPAQTSDAPVEAAAPDVAAEAAPSSPPKIETTALKDALVNQSYEAALFASGGKRPLLWVLPMLPASLTWLRVEATTGVLSGTPPTKMAATSFNVQVVDDDGKKDLRSLSLAVQDCTEGASVPCRVVSNAACLVGVQTCVGGVLQACSGGSSSTDATHCGPTCGSCRPVGDSCASGRCRCGTAEACAGTKGVCCGANGASECVDTQSDARYCGSCDTPCEQDRVHVVAACVGGTCSYACAAGWARCPVGVNTRGCETHTAEDAANCGGCGNVCPQTFTHGKPGAPACADGKCAVICDAGWGDCDGDRGNGCELDVTTTSNCGTCGNACASATGGGARCNQGHCEMTCPAGFNLCGTKCISNDDVDNCGACGNKCTIGANANGFGCAQGKCVLTCTADFANCNGSITDGCEVNVKTNSSNCGVCGHACGGRTCVQGDCCELSANCGMCCGATTCQYLGEGEWSCF